MIRNHAGADSHPGNRATQENSTKLIKEKYLETLPSKADHPLEPFRLTPEFHKRVWGFEDLSPWFDKKAVADPIGEVWLTADTCVVETGANAGKQLQQLIGEFGSQLLGPGRQSGSFPLLVKVLFPREKLSVQVHPDDKLAQKYGLPRGKTECWYALGAEPRASVALGLKPGVTDEQVRKAIEDATLEDLLVYLPFSKGEMIFVDAGTVHAIGPGSVILETQQNSDVTYRLYDYGRPRELHIERSLEAMRASTRAGKVPARVDGNHITLIDEHYFRVDSFKVEGIVSSQELAISDPGGVQVFFVVDGQAKIAGEGFEAFSLSRCQVAVIPASAAAWNLECERGVEIVRMVPKG
jgi:mannose-6-phosphate isomerase